jgi:hypothetical protein
MRTEEIYHEGEEGARRPGIEGAFLFLRVLLCALVVDILIPGSFAYPVIEGKQGTSRLPGRKNRICGWKILTTKAKKAHEAWGLKTFFYSFVFLCAPWWLTFLFPVAPLIR